MIQFSGSINPQEFDELHINLIMIFSFIHGFTMAKGLPVVVTSMIRPENDGISVSRTHQTGRGLDFIVPGIMQDEIEQLVHIVNREFKDEAAISKTTGRPTALVYHQDADGGGSHMHLQVKP